MRQNRLDPARPPTPQVMLRHAHNPRTACRRRVPNSTFYYSRRPAMPRAPASSTFPPFVTAYHPNHPRRGAPGRCPPLCNLPCVATPSSPILRAPRPYGLSVPARSCVSPRNRSAPNPACRTLATAAAAAALLCFCLFLSFCVCFFLSGVFSDGSTIELRSCWTLMKSLAGRCALGWSSVGGVGVGGPGAGKRSCELRIGVGVGGARANSRCWRYHRVWCWQ